MKVRDIPKAIRDVFRDIGDVELPKRKAIADTWAEIWKFVILMWGLGMVPDAPRIETDL